MTKSQRQLSKFTAIFAGGTLFSRVLGLVRDIVLFSMMKASMGPFLVAFKLPNMLRDLIGEGASNAAFVPVFSESIEKDSEEDYRELVSAAMSAMLIVLGILTLLGILLIPMIFGSMHLLSFFTKDQDLSPERIRLMTVMARWMFPYLFFIGMTVFAMGPLFTKKHYATPSWSPALLNLSLIGCCWAFHDRFAEPAYALVLGVWLGGLAQMGVQYWAMGKHVGVWKPNFKLNHPGIRTIFWLLLPVLIGQATGEVNKLVDTLFAASMGDDRVRALYIANRMVQLPLSVLGLAVAAAILPSISRAGARADHEEIRQTLIHGLRQTFFLVFPALLGLIVLREPIIRLLFEHGQFGAADTQQAATALFIYGFGLLSFVWVKVLVTGFYAIKDTRTPVIVASASMFLNILLNFMLVGPLDYKGLALATTISFTLNFVALFVLLCGRFGKLWDAPFIESMTRMSIAAGMMLAVAYGTHDRIALFFPDSRLMAVVTPIGCSVLVYGLLCYYLDVPDLRYFLGLLTRRGNRK